MVEKTFISGGLIDILSPQLSSTLVWCLSHVTHPYVHLTEDSYDQVSLPLLSVFGKDAPSSQWLCVFLLDKEHTMELYKVCLDLIHSYARSNTGKYRRTGLGLDEEESCEDLLQFLKMMTHLTVKDYIDFDGESVKPVDVVVAGLNTILPLMTNEILKFYILVNYVCESCPEKLPTIPHQLFLTFMDLLETGLHNYGPEVRILCLEGIEGVASCHARAGPPHSSQTLTDVIFDQMLSASFDMDTIHSTSGAVYAIICYHMESYLSLANSLISSQSDPQNQSRLMEAFSLLTPPSLPLDSKRTSKITFRKNLEQFLPFVKGFLCYK
ncbi:Exportin-4 [Geodia barretti]|uniref:Exportin-4 n=1 Tax=Geodia barretti TaxID=519541 RepID=A0AA35W899_GEOBA|nr:Exportin-4 [Geodia barretti]